MALLAAAFMKVPMLRKCAALTNTYPGTDDGQAPPVHQQQQASGAGSQGNGIKNRLDGKSRAVPGSRQRMGNLELIAVVLDASDLH